MFRLSLTQYFNYYWRIINDSNKYDNDIKIKEIGLQVCSNELKECAKELLSEIHKNKVRTGILDRRSKQITIKFNDRRKKQRRKKKE